MAGIDRFGAWTVRRGWPVLLLAAIVAAGLVAGGRGPAPAGASQGAGGTRPATASGFGAVPDELIVKFTPGTPADARSAAHQAANADPLEDIPQLNVQRVHVRPGTTVQQAAAAYQSRPDVVY